MSGQTHGILYRIAAECVNDTVSFLTNPKNSVAARINEFKSRDNITKLIKSITDIISAWTKDPAATEIGKAGATARGIFGITSSLSGQIPAAVLAGVKCKRIGTYLFRSRGAQASPFLFVSNKELNIGFLDKTPFFKLSAEKELEYSGLPDEISRIGANEKYTNILHGRRQAVAALFMSVFECGSTSTFVTSFVFQPFEVLSLYKVNPKGVFGKIGKLFLYSWTGYHSTSAVKSGATIWYYVETRRCACKEDAYKNLKDPTFKQTYKNNKRDYLTHEEYYNEVVRNGIGGTSKSLETAGDVGGIVERHTSYHYPTGFLPLIKTIAAVMEVVPIFFASFIFYDLPEK